MIYYTTESTKSPHMVFIGRWSPFHAGHAAIIEKKRRQHPDLPVLIMVRDTATEAYGAHIRAEYIKSWMRDRGIRGTIMLIPDIEGVYWGRTVGYNVGLVDVDEATKRISGSRIRKEISAKRSGWQNTAATKHNADMFSGKISDIVQHGFVVWLTGYPSGGKTTLAHALVERLHQAYPFLRTQLLDGDIVRSGPLGRHVGFSLDDRNAHIMRMGELAKMFADHSILVVCAFVSPVRKTRNEIRSMIGHDRFLEVYVKASKKTRIRRDVKGLYSRALRGEIPDFTGVSSTYQTPLHPDVICDTDNQSPSVCVDNLMRRMFR